MTKSFVLSIEFKIIKNFLILEKMTLKLEKYFTILNATNPVWI